MFSGIVEQVGIIVAIGDQQDKRRITIRTSRRMVATLQSGSSISVEGIWPYSSGPEMVGRTL